jgi:hypothetical protein
MRIVVATHALAAFGGTESYAATLADYLQRLGHDVWMHAPVQGEAAQSLRDNGFRVPSAERELPLGVDGVVANLTDVAYDLMARYPSAAHVYVCHGTRFHLSTPPALSAAAQAVVALNDRVGGWLRGAAAEPEVVRLRQPIDLARFAPRGAPRPRARRLLMLGNYAGGARRDMVERVCRDLGIEVEVRGVTGTPTARPEESILEADIVMGYGRSVLEAMACGRAAYVYDMHGGDGWVTPETYPRLEADGFGGQADREVVDEQRMRRELAAYDPLMGLANRDLIVANHAAQHHASAIVHVLRSLVGDALPSPHDPWRELARMVRAQWALEQQAFVLAAEASGLRARILDLEDEATAAVGDAVAIRATRRYRIAAAVAKPLDRLRARRAGR